MQIIEKQDKTKKDLRADQARINGAKSNGPITPEGKAKSSRNSLKHGYAAKLNLLIDPDDSSAWEAHHAGYLASFNPQTYFESDLVAELAATSWRKSRLMCTEAALIDFQLTVQEDRLNEYFPLENGNPRLHLALAWQGLARKAYPRPLPADPNIAPDPTQPPDGLDIESMELLRRYLTSADRQFRTALLNLTGFRKNFPQTPPEPKLKIVAKPPTPNEPTTPPTPSVTLLENEPETGPEVTV